MRAYEFSDSTTAIVNPARILPISGSLAI